jgi:hypothetical protein
MAILDGLCVTVVGAALAAGVPAEQAAKTRAAAEIIITNVNFFMISLSAFILEYPRPEVR